MIFFSAKLRSYQQVELQCDMFGFFGVFHPIRDFFMRVFTYYVPYFSDEQRLIRRQSFNILLFSF